MFSGLWAAVSSEGVLSLTTTSDMRPGGPNCCGKLYRGKGNKKGRTIVAGIAAESRG